MVKAKALEAWEVWAHLLAKVLDKRLHVHREVPERHGGRVRLTVYEKPSMAVLASGTGPSWDDAAHGVEAVLGVGDILRIERK